MSNNQKPIQAKARLTDSQSFQKRNSERRHGTSFAKQEVNVKAYILAPEGYEALMFAIYFLTIPYLVGLSFLYLFVARASFEHFLNFNLSSFFVIWAIGYELVAVVLLTIIAYNFISSFRSAD